MASNSTYTNFSSNKEKLYYSLDALSSRISDYGYVYLIPITCVFGIITNALTMLVIVKGSLKGILYKYMLFMCVFVTIELILNFFLILVRCGTLCQFGYDYLSKIYDQYFYLYLHNVCIFYIVE